MWQRFVGPCCYKKWLCILLIIIGIIMLAIFVPPVFWLALVGAFLVVTGIILCRG